ncbi:type I restriction enzyme endonuclease domain-containing protein [Bacillus luti]|uniref:type I restriction enzyme endonuclease domain-containing protein n=1 Tax=Bacillus luti TaxID=2026191 RepID=UPI0037769E03
MDFVLGCIKKEQKEYKQIAVEMGKAHSLGAATEEGKAAALELSYFKAIKASLAKLDVKNVQNKSKKEIEARVNQMLERSIISEEVMDVFDSLGIKRLRISILSKEFLGEVRQLKHKKLAVEMLKRLLKKYDYPPSQAQNTLKVVMRQARSALIDASWHHVEKTKKEYK